MEKYWKRSACPYDCPDACGLLVETDGNRIYRVKGDDDHPVTKGFICRKMIHYADTVHNEKRILYPMVRTGKKGSGIFKRVTWDEALEIIGDKWKDLIKTYGAESILQYSYAGVEHLIANQCGEVFFDCLGASRLERTICSKAKTEGFLQMYGQTPGIFIDEIKNSDYIVLWGSNIEATWIHGTKEIAQARKNGSRVVLIETYRSPATKYADDVILLKPGSDGAFALAVAHVLAKEGLLDQAFLKEYAIGYDAYVDSLNAYTPQWAEAITGVPAAEIIDFAKAYGSHKAPLIIMGSGMSRHTNGAMNVRCIISLPALVGAFKHPGGGYWGHIGCSKAFDVEDVFEKYRTTYPSTKPRVFNMNQLGDALAFKENPVRSLYVYNSNPVCIAPDQHKIMEGLSREDLFTVVHERFMTDTARYADVILPADTSVEHGDLVSPYGALCVQYTTPVIQPIGECKSNWDTFCLLAQMMNLDDPLWQMSNDQVQREILSIQNLWRDGWSEEEQQRFMDGKACVLPLPSSLDFQTSQHKILLYNEDIEYPMPVYIPSHSSKIVNDNNEWLALVVAPAVHTLNSTFNEQDFLVNRRGKMSLKINPDDANKRGISQGDLIDVYNDLAHAYFYAQVFDGVPEGTVVAEGVYTCEQSLNGLTVNALLSQRLTDAGAAATLCDNAVKIKKL